MKPTPIEAALELPADAIVYVMRGTVAKVHKRHSGTNSSGEWSIQNLTLKDETGEITVTLKDRDEAPSNWANRVIQLEAYNGEKGWSGVKTWDDEYKGKTTRKIKVTPTGNISFIDDSGAATKAPTAPPAAAAKQEAPAAKQEAPAAPAKQDRPESTRRNEDPGDKPLPQETPEERKAREAAEAADNHREARKLAYQIANMQQLCLNTVEMYTAPRFAKVAGRELTAEEKHAWAMNMSIEMAKKGGVRLMPSTKLSDPTPKANTATTTTATAAATVAKPSGETWQPGMTVNPATGEPCDPETGEILF